MMKRQKIAEAIQRDLTSEQEPADRKTLAEGRPTKCVCCGASYIYRTRADRDGSGRFCSQRCQENYDHGLVIRAPLIRYTFEHGQPVRPADNGFVLECRFCRKPFASKGLRCCGQECERALKDRLDALEVAAQIGHSARPHRVCEGCGGRVPRHARANQRFCSSRCQQKAARQAKRLSA